MRIAIASSSRLALPLVAALEDSHHELCGLITQPDAPKGRGRTLSPSEFATALSDRTFTKPESNEELEKVLQQIHPDLVLTVAYGRLIKEAALSIPRFGWLNLHFSLLPKYRGAAPVQRALLEGAEETGVTVFQLDKGMDTGPIFRQLHIKLLGNETSGELLDTLATLGAPEVLSAVEMIQNSVAPSPQTGIATYAPKLSKAEARIDWNLSALGIERKIRAFNPNPGAWALFRGERVTFKSAVLAPGHGSPGSVLSVDPLVVASREGALQILEIQSVGRRALAAGDWARGSRITVSDRFE